MHSVAIIPARGGSKRIPRKNIKLFGGKPMIARSINVAQKSGLFDRVIVSTDDAEISEISRRHGAETPFIRPPELSTDTAGTTDVVAHAINWLRERGNTIDAVCCIYATAPFIQTTDLEGAKAVFDTEKWDYVFSGTTFAFPIFRSFKKQSDGSIEMFYPEHFKTQSQNLPEAFHDAGQFYWGKVSAWTTMKPIFDKNSTFFELPRWRVQDIDTQEDWERAEIIWHLLEHGVNSLRSIATDDRLLLYKWVNDVETRLQAFNSKLIGLEEHNAWFERKIQDNDCQIYILENNGEPVGQIRFEKDLEHDAILIDFSIDPKFRGKGFGTQIIKMGLAKHHDSKDSNKHYRALVKITNMHSRACFEKNGFKPYMRNDEIVEYRLPVMNSHANQV